MKRRALSIFLTLCIIFSLASFGLPAGATAGGTITPDTVNDYYYTVSASGLTVSTNYMLYVFKSDSRELPTSDPTMPDLLTAIGNGTLSHMDEVNSDASGNISCYFGLFASCTSKVNHVFLVGATDGTIYLGSIAASEGVPFSGTVSTRYLTVPTTLTLSSGGETIETEVISAGATDGTGYQSQDYSFDTLLIPGEEYTLTVTKYKHVTYTETFTAGDEAMTKAISLTLYGDVDRSGNVDSTDAMQVLRSSIGAYTLTGDALKAANVDASAGGVDSTDAMQILRLAIGTLTSFAAWGST